MSDIFDVICTSLSVPRPRFVGREEILAMLREPGETAQPFAPDNVDGDKASLAAPLFDKIATMRVAELVRTGMVSWCQVAQAAAISLRVRGQGNG